MAITDALKQPDRQKIVNGRESPSIIVNTEDEVNDVYALHEQEITPTEEEAQKPRNVL